jgi:hypothetical protein
MRRILVLVLFSGVFACTPASKDTEKDNSENAGKSSQALMQELNSQATAACSQTSDCFNAAAGHRSCGGPESYLIFSRWDSANKIFELLYSYNLKRTNETAGTMGDCLFMLPPSLTCINNICKKNESNPTTNTSAFQIFSGRISLSPRNIADAPDFTFKTSENSESQYVKISTLDLASRRQLESYRQDNTYKSVSVRIFGRYIDASACEFTYASCSTKVSAIEIIAVKFL